MVNCFKRCAIEVEDRLRNSPRVRHWIGKYKAWRDRWARRGSAQEQARSIARLASAARHLHDPETIRTVQACIRGRVEQLDHTRVDWREFVNDAYDQHLK